MNKTESEKMKALAQIISVIFHPIFIPLYLAIIFVNSVFFPKIYKIFIIATIAIFTCIIPLLFMLFKYLNGSISDFYVKERKKRTPIYIVSFVSYIICVVNLIHLQILQIAPFFLFVFVSSLVGVLVIMVINFKWKISAHACGAGVLCGAVFAFAYYLAANPVLLFCSTIFIVGTIISSRLALNAHTFGQVAAGFFVGLIFSLLPIIIFSFGFLSCEN